MKKTYKDEFHPKLSRYDSYFIEIPRECYARKMKKNDILVYSVILNGMNNKIASKFSYENSFIADTLGMNVSHVSRSIKSLEDLGLISIQRYNNKRNITVLEDLRTKDGKKSFIKVYKRIFCYTLINKNMVHVYSYLLSLSQMDCYSKGIKITNKKIADALDYSEDRIRIILKEMAEIKLIKIDSLKNEKYITLLVDFSQEQKEEKQIKDKQEENKQDEVEVTISEEFIQYAEKRNKRTEECEFPFGDDYYEPPFENYFDDDEIEF